MNLAELRAKALAALADGAHPDEVRQAAAMATHMAEMVGWAIGPIDPRGAVTDSLLSICEAVRERFEAGGREPALAGLHDALAELAEAIAAHDRDLEPAADDGEDLVAL